MIQKLAHQQAAAFQIPTTQVEKNGWWIDPPCLEVLGWRKYLPLKFFQWSHNYKEVRKEETVTLAMALQSCTVQSGMPLGVLCGAVQELHQCLAPLKEEGCLLKFEMLDVAEKDPMAPTPASAPSFPTPDPEEGQVILTPKESCTLEPEEAACLEGELTLIWGQYPARPPGVAHLLVTQTHASLGKGIPMRAQLDLHSWESLQVTISHGTAAGEVYYEYQSQVVMQASLQLALFKPSKQSDSPPRIQEL